VSDNPLNIFLHNGVEQFGPYSEKEVQGYIQAGNIQPSFWYCIDGVVTEWRPISESGFFEQPVAEKPKPEAKPKKKSKPKKTADADPLKPVIDEINAQFSEGLTPVIQDSGPPIIFKRVDEYPPVYVYHEHGEDPDGPYVFERTPTYGFEGKNPRFMFEGDVIMQSFDAIKQIWAGCYASNKQVEQLKKVSAEFDESTLTFKEATWALGKIKDEKPATKTNLNKLDELGIKYKEGITRAKAKELIQKHEVKEEKQQFKENLKKAKALGLNVDSKIDPDDLEELVDHAEENAERACKLNEILASYGQSPIRLKKMSPDDAETLLEEYELAIDWARDQSDLKFGMCQEDDDYSYTQNRDLSAEELSALTNECMKKVHRLVKTEADFVDDEKIPMLKKVAKTAFDKERID
jgi:hypothetical protein